MVARPVVLALLALLGLALLFLPSSSPAPKAQAAPFSPPATDCWDSNCYRTNAQIQSFLEGIAASYPQVVTLSDAGASWDGTHRLWLMRLGSSRLPGPHPAIYLLAGQRPLDQATPEMLLRYISYLTSGYGTDPDVTWLLDNRTVWVLPVANPDGY